MKLAATAAHLAEEVEAAGRARAELAASEARFRAVFEHAAVGMGRVGFADARWLEVNDAFCRMLGRSRAELLATPWPEITHPDDVDLDLVPFRRMAAGALEVYTVEKRFLHQAGHHVWARLTLRAGRGARRPSCAARRGAGRRHSARSSRAVSSPRPSGRSPVCPHSAARSRRSPDGCRPRPPRSWERSGSRRARRSRPGTSDGWTQTIGGTVA